MKVMWVKESYLSGMFCFFKVRATRVCMYHCKTTLKRHFVQLEIEICTQNTNE